MINLPQVMLCAATSVAVPQTIEALRRTRESIQFGDVVLFTDTMPPHEGMMDIGRTIQIGSLSSREDYSRFMLSDLQKYVTLDHVLVVQWDGFAINPAAWSADFLDYDYIGAPWPQFEAPFNVGNGGFSLRSRRLLEALAACELEAEGPEDLVICHAWRSKLELEFGIRFAPSSLASQFSYERHEPSGQTFGFHGLFNFPSVYEKKCLRSVLSGLSSDLIGGRDGEDLIISLLRKKDIRNAVGLLRRQSRTGNSSRSHRIYWTKLVRALFSIP